jgi:Holliday junction resolvasome RuvABC DNA-binding subunit
MKDSISTLMKIHGCGKNKAMLILAYCGSLATAKNKNSYLYKGQIPGISKNESLRIFNNLSGNTDISKNG